jgi:hypothetical protein
MEAYLTGFWGGRVSYLRNKDFKNIKSLRKAMIYEAKILSNSRVFLVWVLIWLTAKRSVLGYNIVWSVESQLTFRNMSPSSSGANSKPSNKPAGIKQSMCITCLRLFPASRLNNRPANKTLRTAFRQWRMPSSGIWRRLHLLWTDISEECIASIFNTENPWASSLLPPAHAS